MFGVNQIKQINQPLLREETKLGKKKQSHTIIMQDLFKNIF